MLTRKNILDLLGNDSRKYHSCVISSYSFDFLFFEQRILPKLRAAGISNINVFVDSGMLEKALANFKGGEYLQNKSNYSLTPVTLKGAFHPKIFLAVGKSIRNFEMQVYNRWGKKVFESNDISIGWDGICNGQVCKSEVYTWKVLATDFTGLKKELTGHVMLLR